MSTVVAMADAESEAERRRREADPFIIGLTQHALENADTERLADLIEAFLTSEDQVMRDAFVMGLVRSYGELTPDEYAAALQRVRDQLDNRQPYVSGSSIQGSRIGPVANPLPQISARRATRSRPANFTLSPSATKVT